MNWHRLGIPEVLELTGSNAHGLTTNKAEEIFDQIGLMNYRKGRRRV